MPFVISSFLRAFIFENEWENYKCPSTAKREKDSIEKKKGYQRQFNVSASRKLISRNKRTNVLILFAKVL